METEKLPTRNAIALKKRRDANRDAFNAQARSYRARDPEKFRLKDRIYRDKYREKRKDQWAKWYATHKEERRSAWRKWHQLNGEERRRYIRQWHHEHPEAWRHHNAKRRALQNNAAMGDLEKIKAWRKSWRQELFVQCYWCKDDFPTSRCHEDHKIPLSKGGPHSLENLVIACAVCNHSKHDKLPDEWLKHRREISPRQDP